MVKHCLVTGCTGFIGRHVVKSLLGQGVTVRGLTRGPLVSVPMPNVELIRGDLAQSSTLAGLTKGVDTVIHAAGHAHSQGADIDVHRLTTVEGTRHLLADTEKHGVQRLVYISSTKAMPEPGNECLDETEEGLPEDEYGLSRREAENLVLTAGARTGMHVSILRPALVYGPGCKGNLASLMHWIDIGLFPPIPDTGNIRSMVDVRDLVRAILLAAEKPSANGRTFIITDGEDYSTRRIYAAMRTALGMTVPRWALLAGLLRGLGWMGDVYGKAFGRPALFDSAVCARLLDSACYRSKFADVELGFRPIYRFEDTVLEMVEEHQRLQSL